MYMSKKMRWMLAYISLVLGWIISGFLLRFMFGTRIYFEWQWRYLFPSRLFNLPFAFDYYVEVAFNAIVYAIIIYVLLYILVKLWVRSVFGVVPFLELPELSPAESCFS